MRVASICAVLAVVAGLPATAQVMFDVNVTDPSGAVVPGARVIVTADGSANREGKTAKVTSA
jgi:hypothetical protein